MRRSLNCLALCALSALLGLAVTAGLTGSKWISGAENASLLQRSFNWTVRAPLLNQIATPRTGNAAATDAASGNAWRRDTARADELVTLAAQDPARAMRDATALNGHWLRLDTLERVAAAWAADLPAQALSYVETSRELGEVRRTLRAVILDIWAQADPTGALSYLTGPVGSSLFFTDQVAAVRTVRSIADLEPRMVLAWTDARPPGYVRNEVRREAIAVIAERDPEFAENQIALARSESEAAEWQGALDSIEMLRNFARAEED